MSECAPKAALPVCKDTQAHPGRRYAGELRSYERPSPRRRRDPRASMPTNLSDLHDLVAEAGSRWQQESGASTSPARPSRRRSPTPCSSAGPP
ncbi:MAG: hypothetical protein ACLU9S_13765 [Oscillospiraceae bacterium]